MHRAFCLSVRVSPLSLLPLCGGDSQDPAEAAALAQQARERLLAIAQTQAKLRREQRHLLAFLWRLEERGLSADNADTPSAADGERLALDEQEESPGKWEKVIPSGSSQGEQKARDSGCEEPTARETAGRCDDVREKPRRTDDKTREAFSPASVSGDERVFDGFFSALSRSVLYPDEQQLLLLQLDQISRLPFSNSRRASPPTGSPSRISSALRSSPSVSSSSSPSSSSSSSPSSSSSSSFSSSSSSSSPSSASAAFRPSAPVRRDTPSRPGVRPSFWGLATCRASSRTLAFAPRVRWPPPSPALAFAQTREASESERGESQTEDATDEASTDEETRTLEDEEGLQDEASSLAADQGGASVNQSEVAKRQRREAAAEDPEGEPRAAIRTNPNPARGSNHMAGLMRTCMQSHSARRPQEDFLLVGGEWHGSSAARCKPSSAREDDGRMDTGDTADKPQKDQPNEAGKGVRRADPDTAGTHLEATSLCASPPSSSAADASSTACSSSAPASPRSPSALVRVASALRKGLRGDCVSAWLSAMPSNVQAFFPAPLRQLQFARHQSAASIADAAAELREKGEEAWRRGDANAGVGFFFFHLFLEEVLRCAANGSACTCARCLFVPDSQWTECASQETEQADETREAKEETPETDAEELLAEGAAAVGARTAHQRGGEPGAKREDEELDAGVQAGPQSDSLDERAQTRPGRVGTCVGLEKARSERERGSEKESRQVTAIDKQAGVRAQTREERGFSSEAKTHHNPEGGQRDRENLQQPSSSVCSSSASASLPSAPSSAPSLPNWISFFSWTQPPQEETPANLAPPLSRADQAENNELIPQARASATACSPVQPVASSFLSVSSFSSFPTLSSLWQVHAPPACERARTVSSPRDGAFSVSASSFLSAEDADAALASPAARSSPEGNLSQSEGENEESKRRTADLGCRASVASGDKGGAEKHEGDAGRWQGEDGVAALGEKGEGEETECGVETDGSDVEELTCVIVGERRGGEATLGEEKEAHADTQRDPASKEGGNEGKARKEGRDKGGPRDSGPQRKMHGQGAAPETGSVWPSHAQACVDNTPREEQERKEGTAEVIDVDGSEASSPPRTDSQQSQKRCLDSPQTPKDEKGHRGRENGTTLVSSLPGNETRRRGSEEAKENENACQWTERPIEIETSCFQKSLSSSQPQPSSPSASPRAFASSLRSLSSSQGSTSCRSLFSSAESGKNHGLHDLAALPLLERLRARLGGGASLAFSPQPSQPPRDTRGESPCVDAENVGVEHVPTPSPAAATTLPLSPARSFPRALSSFSPASSSASRSPFPSSILCEIDWSTADASLVAAFGRHFGLKKRLPDPLLRRMLHRICVYLVTHVLHPLSSLPPFDFLRSTSHTSWKAPEPQAASSSAEETLPRSSERASSALARLPSRRHGDSTVSPSSAFSRQKQATRGGGENAPWGGAEGDSLALGGDEGGAGLERRENISEREEGVCSTPLAVGQRRSRRGREEAADEEEENGEERAAERGEKRGIGVPEAYRQVAACGETERRPEGAETETVEGQGETRRGRAKASERKRKGGKRNSNEDRQRREEREDSEEAKARRKKRRTPEKHEVEVSAEAIQVAIMDHDQLYEKLLTHQNVELKEVYLHLRARGMQVSMAATKAYLQAAGVYFATPWRSQSGED
ncbi:conserved hypothetical protein [Neospora caninum Liverpool]|uniref:Structure-specific endonuclease subunit SLX4 n=1 Tax=Neospora caninum (strain Liverpool) TaxID=572307 RepID=F0VRR3_NEOCL|nr:conserved hypothetical protein [Neospora caninum Liverpool]CBZ56411.1 conserved hypothetical protein [Neospora caninum Liverpool]|eukprot:XP_003886436.1 conserved hypothetical protein [Neospora caninum Liverpool]